MKKRQKKTNVIFNLTVAHTCFWDGELMRSAARGNAEKRPATLGKFNWKPIRASIAAACSSTNCSQLGTEQTALRPSCCVPLLHLYLLYKTRTKMKIRESYQAVDMFFPSNYWTEFHSIWYWRLYTKRCWRIYIRSVWVQHNPHHTKHIRIFEII
jgi:hypothetical protein